MSKLFNKIFVIKWEEGGYLLDLLNVLYWQGVEVYEVENDFSFGNCLDYCIGEKSMQFFLKGDILVSVDQVCYLFVYSIFECNMVIEDLVMYDMVIWLVLLVYNFEVYFSLDVVKVV